MCIRDRFKNVGIVSFPFDTNHTLKRFRSSPEGDISFTFALQRNQSHQCEEITFEQKKLTLILILPKKVAPVVEFHTPRT